MGRTTQNCWLVTSIEWSTDAYPVTHTANRALTMLVRAPGTSSHKTWHGGLSLDGVQLQLQVLPIKRHAGETMIVPTTNRVVMGTEAEGSHQARQSPRHQQAQEVAPEEGI